MPTMRVKALRKLAADLNSILEDHDASCAAEAAAAGGEDNELGVGAEPRVTGGADDTPDNTPRIGATDARSRRGVPMSVGFPGFTANGPLHQPKK